MLYINIIDNYDSVIYTQIQKYRVITNNIQFINHLNGHYLRYLIFSSSENKIIWIIRIIWITRITIVTTSPANAARE